VWHSYTRTLRPQRPQRQCTRNTRNTRVTQQKLTVRVIHDSRQLLRDSICKGCSDESRIKRSNSSLSSLLCKCSASPIGLCIREYSSSHCSVTNNKQPTKRQHYWHDHHPHHHAVDMSHSTQSSTCHKLSLRKATAMYMQ
jgi:hypothetical protein